MTPTHRCLLALLVLAVMATSRTLSAAHAAPHERRVMCWYMVCFGNSVEGYMQEIELAQRHGIDGFLLDVGEWQKLNNGKLEPTGYVQSAQRLYEAARRLDSGFVLAMAPEYSVRPFVENVHNMVMQFRDHPNQFRIDGKVVLSGYGDAALFPPAVERLKADGVEVFLIPSVFLPRFVYRPDALTFVHEFVKTPQLDGLMMFNPSELGTIIADNASARRATLAWGKTLAAGVVPAYNSANLQDYRGLGGYLDMWRGAIADGADWISLVIWNDYNEDSALMPARWPFGSERYLYSRDESYLHATAYASAWFKSRTPPAIAQDRLFVTYRNRSKWLRQAWDGKQWVDLSLNTRRFDQMHDDVADRVYVDTFLTEPATVTVEIGEQVERFDLPAGMSSVHVPLVPGTPRLVLQRDGRVLADVLGRRQIIDEPTPRNSLLGYHAANRTWASGTAIGPVVARLEASRGELLGDATVVTHAGVSAVLNNQTQDSGFAVPVSGLATATYNVRIHYVNPTGEETRLTLFADGAPRARNDHPPFIPAYLPPTTDGQFQTVSFFWSLYDTTTTLKLQWTPGQMWGKPDPVDDDYGTAMVAAIELVKVEPVAMPPAHDPRIPELVWIPGGEFVMGSDRGEPDELPRRAVRISGFAIGKHEVTNEAFELFDPGHRKFRNGNSWRNREPVLHVSWADAARYCNWLSRQHGLTPVYNERDWTADLDADGFGLPTEAQWEYVATGRGEGRTYPWGEDAPVPGVHGRFVDPASLGANLPRPSTENAGTVIVGSFPAGASRDGVMDLAGNAAEWCTDWYDHYSDEHQTDPCQTKPGNFRVIRGGSWSWYNHSQRSADREFNSPNYPGHAYYGLRVALPETGWRKLNAASIGE